MPVLVQQHQPVLLAADANALNLLAADTGLAQCLLRGTRQCLQPLLGVLLSASVLTLDQRMGRSAQPQYLAAVAVEDQRFGALCTAVDAQE